MTLRPFALLSACFALFLLASPARAEVSVLTSIKPLQLVAAAIQDGVGQPDVLLPPGASPHQYALRPSDVRRLREVQLFYWIGPDLENFLPKVLAGRQGTSVAVQDLPGMHLRKFVNFEEEEHAGHDEHDHDHRPGMLDAHLWLLPANARTIAARMAEDLAQVDPANAGRYRANLKASRSASAGSTGNSANAWASLPASLSSSSTKPSTISRKPMGCAIPACSRYPRRSSREHAMSPPCAPS